MKVEVVETACPAATGNYDITGTSPTNDMVGAIFLSTASTTNNTNVASLRWGLGATDMLSNIAVSMGGQDATAGAGIRSMLSNTNCLFNATGLGGQTAPVASFNIALPTGIRLTTTSVTVGRFTNTMLISGTDTVMRVGSQLFGAADTTKTITHNLGGTPDLIILLCSFGQSVNEGDGNGFSVGFWDNRTANQTSISYHATDIANPTDNSAYASSTSVGEILSASASLAHVTLASIGATTFKINLSAATGQSNYFGWIALRGASLQMHTKNILMQVPTSTGNATLVAGMSGRPQAYLALPTRIVTANSVVTDDTAGSFGGCVGATNDYLTSTYGCVADTFKDAVATSVARHMISNTLGVLEVDNTGNADYQGTINSWDVAGMTMNWSNVPASLLQMAVLAFGAQTPATSSLRIPQRFFRPVNTIYYPR